MNILDLNKEYLTEREAYIQSLQDKYSNGELYLSYSSLSSFRKSPKHFIDYKMKDRSDDTDSMILGSAMHCMVLEPHEFNFKFAIQPECDKRTKDGKEIYLRFLETSKNKTVISNNQYLIAIQMASSLLLNDEAKELINNSIEREKKIHFDRYGFKFVSILDGEGNDYVFDLKMMPDADPKKVQREILNRTLWLQGGMYLEALQQDKAYYIIAVDKSGNVSVHLLMESLLDYGKSEFKRLCADFEDCMSTNSWYKSYDYRSHNGIYPIDKPSFNI